jgi:rod shape-determining protein MreD
MIIFSFLLSIIALFLKITTFPDLPILPFIPFLALLSLLRPFSKVLLAATLSGFIVDLLSSDPLGIHALNYTLCILICFRFRSLFSSESPLQLVFYATLYSFVSTQLQIGLLFLFDRRVEFLGKWWLMQWMSLPVIDAIYAFVWFAGPLALYRTMYRTWTVYWLKKNNPISRS